MDTVDRISELPDPLLHHILSSLPLQQVVRTIELSKRWRQLWDTYPIFEIDGNHNSFDRSKMMWRCLEQTLLNRCTDRISVKVFTLKLFLPVDDEILISLSQCLSYAIESNVKILKLLIWSDMDDTNLPNLPPIVFCTKSIEVLELCGCNLVHPKSNVMLSSLRRLCLSYVTADDNVIDNVVVGSPLIEHLEIICCRGLTSLELASLHRLKKVILFDNDTLKRLKINAKNVCKIDVCEPSLSEFSLGACENLKCLILHKLSIGDNLLWKDISKCPLLELLSIDKCNKLELIKVSSHHLKTLDIFGCSNLEHINVSSHHLKTLSIIKCSKLLDVNIETPNLSIFKYKGDLITFSSNDLALSEANLHFDSENIDTQWFVRYIELLAKFRLVSKALTLNSNTGESVNVPEELRKILRPPLSGISQLTLILHGMKCSFSEIVDGLLWISPHVETIFVRQEDGDGDLIKTIQLSYKKEFICEEGSKTPHCCQFFPVSCWEHCMKEVNIEIVKTCLGETVMAMRSSLQNRHLLEQMDHFCAAWEFCQYELYIDKCDNIWWSYN